ncbi:MAG: serine/threonine protein phosphatase [Kofleriaceae bacterium]|nr:MAG: serine/threonine protein phosphatase [Kofleriaceae bacterium]MBZ0234171.1 serine/threonine protein phosphatase [Kofleriaceae bacterium]
MLTFSTDPNVAEQQMNAIIFYLTAFGYIDGDFDQTEKTFVKIYIRQLVAARARELMPEATPTERTEVVNKFVAHFHEVFEQIDHEIRGLFEEVVSDQEKVEQFVYAKIKLRCYEIFNSFDEGNQRALLSTIDELIYADGSVHPAEEKFRSELDGLLHAEQRITADQIVAVEAPPVEIEAPAQLAPRLEDHPFFMAFEQHYSADPERLRKQAEADFKLMQSVAELWKAQRIKGEGKLDGKHDVAQFAGQEPFLDGHVYVHPAAPGETYELTVLGDLHGCYSCLKAAVMQADFFAKVEAYRLDRTKPNPKLVLLGDYIDRGRFSYNGILRSVMQMFVAAPEHVYILRGNHEYYIEYKGRIYGGVKPAEAINTLIGYMPGEMFEAYMHFFEQMPNMLLFDRLVFVHAGIPRDSAIAEKYSDLASLNDSELRFQMLWSDPSTADYIPDDLQAQNARFPFGRLQFEKFMGTLGCTMLVRGHEKIDEGFKSIYPESSAALLNLFSAGGAENNDLPENSSYRTVTPMALTIQVEQGNARVTPWEIDYRRFNDPKRNRFFASPPEIEHKQG